MTNLMNWGVSTPSKHVQHPFLKMQTALDKLMQDFYGGFELPSFSAREFENLVINPSVDIIDDEKHFKVEVEMPGMGEEDIQVSINEGVLNIKGEKKTSHQDKDKNYRIREITYGSYERNIRLPSSVDIDQARASFKKGMLWVDLPKKPGDSAKSKKLQIEAC